MTTTTRVAAALAAAGVLAAGLAAPAAAEARRVPAAQKVGVLQVSPGTLGTDGSYQITLQLEGATPDVCSFALYRYTTNAGSRYLGRYYSTQTNDLARPSWGSTYYLAYPYDCNGNVGDETYSETFRPYTADQDDNAYVWRGSGSHVAQAGAYGGTVLRSTSRGAAIRVSTDYAYNVALTVMTGPQGGTGTIYVDGARKGTISFYSPQPKVRKVVYKFGKLFPSYRTIEIRQTGTGARGGVQMYVDALAQNLG